MTEATSAVRADIEATRERMATAITQLERKVDIAERIRENPWPALAIAFGAGLALSATGSDVRAARVTSEAAQGTTSKLASTLDGILAAAIGGVAASFQGHLEGALSEVMASVKGTSTPHETPARAVASGAPIGTSAGMTNHTPPAMRAD